MRIIRLKCDECGRNITNKDHMTIERMDWHSKKVGMPSTGKTVYEAHVCSSSCWRKVMDRIYKEHTENLRFWKKGKK